MATQRKKAKPAKARKAKGKAASKRKAAKAKATSSTSGKRRKKSPASAVTPTRASREPRTGLGAPKASPRKRAKVKPRPSQKPNKRAPAKRAPARPAPRKRKLSKHPEAIRSRKRRREQRGVREQEAFEAEDAKRRSGDDERALAEGWLEAIRNDVATVFPVSLTLTEPEAGASMPWLIVGRFDPLEEIGYEDLADALEVVRDDLVLEAQIHPQRMSQIRIVYADPRAKGGEGDSIVSKSGAWEFVVSDLIGELVGGGGNHDEADPDSLAGRYSETTVPVFYVYFSAQVVQFITQWPGNKAQPFKLK